MKVDIKEISSCEKILTIDVPSEMVTEEFSAFYQEVGKRAKIPGFRPGHAPKQVVALHFRDQARQEVWKQLVSRTLQDAVRQKEIPMIGYPHVENVEFDETRLKFKARVETRPKIKIDKYAGLALKRDPLQVSEAEMTDALRRIQESHAKFQAVENREAQLGDFLVCDYRLEVDGRELEKREGEWIEIQEKDYLEGFSRQLIGAKTGEAKEVVIIFPPDYARKELASKEGHFFITVREIKEKKLPSLDDELAKETGEYETLEGLKKAIHNDFENHKRLEIERKLEHLLLDELVKKSKFEIPSGMVERRLNALIEDQIRGLISRGAKEEEAKAQEGELRKNMASHAEKQVRISFLLDEIANREHIEANEADLAKKYDEMAQQARRSAEEVKAYYSKEEERRQSLLQQIVSEKTIQWLKDKATITEHENKGGKR